MQKAGKTTKEIQLKRFRLVAQKGNKGESSSNVRLGVISTKQVEAACFELDERM